MKPNRILIIAGLSLAACSFAGCGSEAADEARGDSGAKQLSKSEIQSRKTLAKQGLLRPGNDDYNVEYGVRFAIGPMRGNTVQIRFFDSYGDYGSSLHADPSFGTLIPRACGERPVQSTSVVTDGDTIYSVLVHCAPSVAAVSAKSAGR